MKIKVLEGFEPNAGDIKVFNNSESSLVKFAIEAANSLLTDDLSTWHKRIGQDDDNYYEIVLGVDDEDYICIKWAFIPKNSAMNEYSYDYMFPYDEKTGDVWDSEESIAKSNADDYIDNGFVKSAVSYILKDFKKYVEMHNKEIANEGFKRESVNSNNLEKIAKTNKRDFAEVISNEIADMDWQDYVDGYYDTVDEAWEEFVDTTYQTLLKDPKAIISYLENDDTAKSEELIKLINKYYVKGTKESFRRPLKKNKNKVKTESFYNVKESKMLKEGPGAGYTINWECDNIGNINSYKITNAYKNKYDLWAVEVDCDIDMKVDINSYWSYYYGSNENLENVNAKIYRITIDNIDIGNLIDDEDVYDNMSDEEIENYLLSADASTFRTLLDIMEYESYIFDHEQEFVYGGGWSHATWDGEIADIEDNEEITAYVTDKKVIAFVDKAVQGDTQWSDYELYDQDNEPMELTFETEDEAKDNAEKILSQDERYTKIVCWRNDWKENFNGDTDLVDEDRAFILYADDYR